MAARGETQGHLGLGLLWRRQDRMLARSSAPELGAGYRFPLSTPSPSLPSLPFPPSPTPPPALPPCWELRALSVTFCSQQLLPLCGLKRGAFCCSFGVWGGDVPTSALPSL